MFEVSVWSFVILASLAYFTYEFRIQRIKFPMTMHRNRIQKNLSQRFANQATKIR